jgi:hypothetical protein
LARLGEAQCERTFRVTRRNFEDAVISWVALLLPIQKDWVQISVRKPGIATYFFVISLRSSTKIPGIVSIKFLPCPFRLFNNHIFLTIEHKTILQSELYIEPLIK